MKKCLLPFITLTFCLNLFSQNICSKYIQTNYDRITDRTTIIGKDTVIVSADGRTGLGIISFLLNDTLVVSIKAVGGGCLEDKRPIFFLFTDGSRLQLENQTKFNCDNEARLYFGRDFNNLDSLVQLASKKIDAMRVTTMKNSVTADFRLPQATILMNQINCLRLVGGEKFEEKKEEKTDGFSEKRFESSPLDKIEPTPPEKTVVDKDSPAKPPEIVALGVLNGKAIKPVDAPYPSAAKAVHAAGQVNVRILVDTDGNVVSAIAESGHPLLRQSAESAARQTKFSPTILSGKPVQVSGVLVFNFIYK